MDVGKDTYMREERKKKSEMCNKWGVERKKKVVTGNGKRFVAVSVFLKVDGG